ncbi:MAG: NHL repeat-containing protein, partial [Bacteroidota bacterium]
MNYQGQGIQSQGVYHFQLTNVLGCDSVVVYTVDTMPTSFSVQANSSCIGASLIVSPTVPDWSKIEWLKGNTVVKNRPREYQSSPTWSTNSYYPAGIFYHQQSGGVYVVEHGNHRVVRWLPGSTSPQVVAGGNGGGSGSNQLNGPYDLYVTPSGSVYVSDYHNARVQRWDPGSSTGVTVAGGNGQGSANHQLYQPIGVWVDALGRLYVADYGNNRVVRWDQGVSSGVVYRSVESPTDILFDQNNNFYAASNNQHAVFRWAPGSNQAVAAAFARHPHQIAIDGGGDLWVTQHMSNKVSRHHFSSPNEISLNLNFSCNPFGIAITDSGSLYVGSHLCSQSVARFSPASYSMADTFQTETSGQYQARVVRSNGCSVNSQAFTIQGTPVEIKGPPVHELCQGDTLLLESSLLRYDLQFQWLRNGQPIAGAMLSSLRIWQDGDYQLRVTDSSGCSLISKNWIIKRLPIVAMTASCPSNVLTLQSQDSNISKLQWFRNDSLVQSNELIYLNPVHRGSTNYGAKGVFKDSNGDLYVADTESDRVLKFASGSTSGTVVAGGNGRGSGAHQLNQPSSVFVDTKGIIYVSDQFNHRVMAWSQGSSSGIVVAGGNGPGSGSHQLNSPYGVCLNNKGRLLISDQGNHRIVEWAVGSLSGTRILGISGLPGMGPDMLHAPAGLFLDSKGFLFIADRNNHRIQRWIPGTLFSQTVAGGYGQGNQLNQLSIPSEVYVDVYGAIYVSDLGNNRVVLWNNLNSTGQQILSSNFLASPRGLVMDNNGNLCVMNEGWASLRSYSKEPISIKALVPLKSGRYTAKITTSGGCLYDVEDTASIPNQVVVLVNGAKESCPGDTLVMTSVQESGYTYQWQRNGIDILGATGLAYTTVETGNYRLKVTGGVGCSYSKEISFRPFPTVTLNATVNSACNPGILSIAGSDDNISGVMWYRDGLFQHRWESQYTSTSYSSSGYNSPHGVHMDRLGNVYIADFENDRVLRRDVHNGSIQVVAGGNGRGSALNQLNRPVMVYVDEFGWVYVSDMGNHRVMKWAQGGTTGQIVAGGNGAGSMLNQLNHPHGIALDAYGALIVVDHYNHRVMRWAIGSTQGIIIAGGQGVGSQANQLNGPAGLTIGYDGTLYIADYNNNRIQAWQTGSVTGSTVAWGNGPWGLAIDASATLYFTSRASNHVMQWRKGAQTGRVIVGYNGASHVVG